MKYLYKLLLLSIFSSSFTNISHAQGVKDLVVPCAVPFYRELDFIVGDWLVYHKSTGEIAGYDRIGRTLRGCAIQQSWISLDDHYSSKYVPFRMNGKSLTAFDGSKWVHMWVDNQAGVQILEGGPDKDKFVLSTQEPIGGFEYQISWQRQDDGSLINLHQRRTVEEGTSSEWEVLNEWRYVKNINRDLYPEEDDETQDE